MIVGVLRNSEIDERSRSNAIQILGAEKSANPRPLAGKNQSYEP